MLPRAPRFKRPLHRCNACDPKCGSQWSCSTSCGCSSVRLPTGGGTLVRFDFHEIGGPGWIRTINLPSQNRALFCLSYRATRNGSGGWNRTNFLQLMRLTSDRCSSPGLKNDPPAGAAPAWSLYESECIADLCHGGILRMVLPRGLAPRTSAFAERRAELLHLGSLKNGAPCRCCPGARGLEDRRACCYTNDANESGGCVRYRAGLSSSSARR